MLRAALTLGVVGSLSASSGAAIIYDARGPGNSTVLIAERDEPDSLTELTPPGSGPRETDSRAGDRITFAGTDRFVTRFTTRVQAFNGSPVGITLGVQLSMYEVGAGGLPGALIWQGNASPVSLASNSPVEAVFTPDVIVPDAICFGVGFYSIVVAPRDSRVFGVVSTARTQVGTSPTTRIRQDTGSGLWVIEDQTDQFGGAFHHIEARVEAIPSPGSATTLFAACIPLARRRRRTR